MDACLDTLSDELCQVNTYVGYIAWRQVAISGFTAYTSPSPLASEDESDEGSNSDDEMSTWFTYPLSLMTKRGSSFDWYESSYIHRGRVSIGDFCDKGSVYTIRDVVRFLCIFFYFSSTFTSCILVLWPFDIHCTYIWIYICWCMLFTYLNTCCFFSLFMHMILIYCMQSFISISH